MTTDELIKALMNLADLGIVNYKAANDTIRAAAFLIDVQAHQIEDLKEQVYQLQERIGIMEDGNQVTIGPGANVDLTAILDSIDKATSGLIEEE